MSYSWNRASIWIVVVMLAAAQGACSRPIQTVAFNSRVDLEGAAPIERLLVFTHFAREDPTYDGFQTGMTNMLERCGVGFRSLNAGSGGLEERADVQAAREFHPSTTLAIELVRHTGYGRIERRMVFELRLLDFRSGKLSWLARMEVSLQRGGRDSGASFAASIIARLQADGVLKTCPRTGLSTTHL